MNVFIKSTLVILLWNYILRVGALNSTNEGLPTCEVCLENKGECLNSTEITIESRATEYIDISKNSKKGGLIQISYIVTSVNNDQLDVQVENENQYIIESKDSGVNCSTRTNLKFYEQNEKLAIYCSNYYYPCRVKYSIIYDDVEKERDDLSVPKCEECSKKGKNHCFESIATPVHSWYYLYYDGDKPGMYVDFLISSHKKDTMRIELQSRDGLFYLVGTRRDKVRCSDPQVSIPVRWSSTRIAVYCYNNYIPCKFSVFIKSTPMDSSTGQTPMANISSLSGYANQNTTLMADDQDSLHWSEWSEWSKCTEYYDGTGRRQRTRNCIQTFVDVVDPDNLTKKDYEELMKSSDYPYCEGSSVDVETCELGIKPLWGNVIMIFFVIAIIGAVIYVKKNPDTQKLNRSGIIKTFVDDDDDDDDKNINDRYKSSTQNSQYKKKKGRSETSPLLQTFVKKYSE